MKTKKPAEQTIKRELKRLRKICEESKNPYEARMAQAIEYGIRWVTEETCGWPPPSKEADCLAKCLMYADLRIPTP